ncbi:MAG: hypothetical protein AAF468_13240 [Pseudomonadota bacterium]
MLDFFAQTRTIVISLLAVAVLSVAFGWVFLGIGNEPMLDAYLFGSEARERLRGLSPAETRIHIIGTATIDMLYPFAYGIFLSGVLYRLAGAWRNWLAVLPLLAIGFDLFENIVQLLALTKSADLLDLKSFLTGPKFTLLVVSVAIILLMLLSQFIRSIRGRGGA